MRGLRTVGIYTAVKGKGGTHTGLCKDFEGAWQPCIGATKQQRGRRGKQEKKGENQGPGGT